MPSHRHPARSLLMSLYRRGELTSIAEGVIVASVPRQTVGRWLREDGIDVGACRLKNLARMHMRAERHIEGKPARRPMTKRQLRAAAARAQREWSRRGSHRERAPSAD